MAAVGDDAPTFTASLVTDDIVPFDLADQIGDEPVVLAFFPAAFSNTCTAEMETLRDRFDRDNCTLFGVSTDLPHALATYRRQYELPFGLVADPDNRGVTAYGVADDSFEGYGVDTVAKRAVFVISSDGVVTYRWLADSPKAEPPYDTLSEVVTTADSEE